MHFDQPPVRGLVEGIVGDPALGGSNGKRQIAARKRQRRKPIQRQRQPAMPPFALDTHPGVELGRIGQIKAVEKVAAVDGERGLKRRARVVLGWKLA
jgi:hypothetical protein